MPSWLTGIGSVPSGDDSALTATGVCAPLHPDFIKDGASFLTGTESVLTAATPDPCELLPPIIPDGFLWLNNKLSPDGLMVKDGSNRVSNWINQFTGVHAAVNALAESSPGVPMPVGEWPVWAPNLQNGLPGMVWSQPASTHLHGNYPLGTTNKPTADNAPVTILGVVRVADAIGGMMLTLRLNNDDLECGVFKRTLLGGTFQIPMSSSQDGNGVIFGHGLTPDVYDFTGQTLVVSYTFFGGGIAPIVRFNGAVVSLYSVDTTLRPYLGESGYSVGYCNANFNSIWRGNIFEILGYLGTDTAVRTAAEEYLNAKWAVY